MRNSLERKRQRDEQAAFGWLHELVRDLKTDWHRDRPWFWLNVVFFTYMIGAGSFACYLLFELTFGSMSILRLL